MLVNVHLKEREESQGLAVFRKLAELGEDAIVIGGFNASPWERPTLPAQTSGAYYLADEPHVPADKRHEGGVLKTRPDGRWID